MHSTEVASPSQVDCDPKMDTAPRHLHPMSKNQDSSGPKHVCNHAVERGRTVEHLKVVVALGDEIDNFEMPRVSLHEKAVNLQE